MKRPAEVALEATLRDLSRRVPATDLRGLIARRRGRRSWRPGVVLRVVLGSVLAALAVGASYCVGLADVGWVGIAIVLAVLIVGVISRFDSGETVLPSSPYSFLLGAACISLVFEAVVIVTDSATVPNLSGIAVGFSATVVVGLLITAVSWSRVRSVWYAWLFGRGGSHVDVSHHVQSLALLQAGTGRVGDRAQQA